MSAWKSVRMNGKRVVVTGANSGIGKAVARDLYGRGADVTMLCRSRPRGEAAKAEIEASGGDGSIELRVADLGDHESLRAFADELPYDTIDVLMNNAGVYYAERGFTASGHERMMGINHLGPFLLTNLLWDRLKAAGGARVVTTSSIAHHLGRIAFDNLQCEQSFSAMPHYGTTKLANALFTRTLAHRGAGAGITAVCYHPGAVGTGFAQQEPKLLGTMMTWRFVKGILLTPEQGASTGIFLATAPGIEDQSGEYFSSRRKSQTSRVGRDLELAERLWNVSETLCGI